MTAKPGYLHVLYKDRMFVEMVGEKYHDEKGKYIDNDTGKDVKQFKRIKKITQTYLNHNDFNTETNQ